MKTSKFSFLVFTVGILILIVLLSSCASSESIETCVSDEKAGIFLGFWHGITVLVSLIGSLFSSDIAIYAVNNTGWFYDFGFIIGIITMTVISSILLTLSLPFEAHV